METFDDNLVHFVRGGVIPVSSQAVDAGPDQEMSSDLLCCAEKVVDVTLAIINVDASSRMIQELRRLLEIFQCAAANPSGTLSTGTARLECIRMPQARSEASRLIPSTVLLVMPIASDFSG